VANPLARVVMENIAKKSNFKDTVKKEEYPKRSGANKARTKTFKSLDKVADEIRGYTKERPLNTQNVNSKQKGSNNISKNNLSLKELELLSGAIKGDIKVKNKSNVSKERNNTLSLDRLAKNIKNNI
jgi:hypothetical protein